ncbi:hypothetical protein OH76DRAFT_1430136 [Lentinus brumalis]|uniref:Uncharacterized protein n=1 Tax=Lentinus brumalis TaxID=2498619 RepID=A0A371DPW5_9APHY|nr:hypothetical protein OH76DRAFT_1430136 [Polyporus brumalis]
MAAVIVYHTGSCHRRSSRNQGLLFCFFGIAIDMCNITTCYDLSRPTHDFAAHTTPDVADIYTLHRSRHMHAFTLDVRSRPPGGVAPNHVLYIPRYRKAIH